MRGGIGDIVLFSSVLKAFRKKHPQKKIIAGTSLGCAELVRSIPYIDDVIVDFRPRFVRYDRGRCWYRDRRTGFLLSHIDAYYSLLHPYKDLSEEEGRSVHIIDLAARILDVAAYERKGSVFFSETHVKNSMTYPLSQPSLIVSPTCSQSKKTPDYRLMRRIVKGFEDIGYSCVKLLAPGMDISEIECPRVSFASILDTAAFIKQATYYVGLDSGLSHIAAALEVPMSTIHVGYTLERSGVLSRNSNPMFFNNRDIPEESWENITQAIIAHAISS